MTIDLSNPSSSANQTLRGCRVYNNAATTIASNGAVGTPVNWQVEEYDTDGYHSTSSNISRITIPSGLGGYYRLDASLWFVLTAAGIRAIYWRKNGNTNLVGYTQVLPSGSNNLCYVGPSIVVPLVAGDYVECMGLQNCGSNLDVDTVSFASVIRVGT